MSEGSKYGRIILRKVPYEWIELIKQEAEKNGISVSDYVKAVILAPWVLQKKRERGEL